MDIYVRICNIQEKLLLYHWISATDSSSSSPSSAPSLNLTTNPTPNLTPNLTTNSTLNLSFYLTVSLCTNNIYENVYAFNNYGLRKVGIYSSMHLIGWWSQIFFNTIMDARGTITSKTFIPVTLSIRKEIKFYLAIVAVILRAR